MESLYFIQSEIAESIRKLTVNFKKDSVERKTLDYCKRKLELLEKYWEDFQVNHEKILPFEKTDHKYFTKSEFESTKQLYLAAKELISQCKEQLMQQAQKASYLPQTEQLKAPGTSTSQPDPPATATPTFESRGSNSKLDDMLHKQSVNFKAFLRAIDNIDVETIVDKWEFEDALRTLHNRWTTIDNLHWEIIGESGEDLAEDYEYYFSKYERTFINLKKAINSKMWSTSYREKSTPQMDIPVFTGHYQQWMPFKDLFSEAIHKNNALSNAQKMQYLKGKLKGEAERLIQHLPISADNYNVCWEILNHRFDNKRIIFTAHANVFLNVPNIQQQSFTAFKKLHDVTLESLHAIKNLGADISTWDPLLVHILSQKLDSESYSEYIESLKNPRELPILQDFLDFLENKFTSLETSRRRQDLMQKSVSSQQQAGSSKSLPNSRKFNNNYKSNDYNSKNAKAMHVQEIKCPHCFAEHKLHDCERFRQMPKEMKLKTVKQLKCCINCVFNHNGNKCHSKKRCLTCSGRHHTLLHDCFAEGKQNNTNDEDNKQGENSKQSSGNGVHASQQNLNQILLATALIRVTSADSTQLVLRALIDQGSQVSLITEKAAQQLGLKRQQFDGAISGIGEKESNCTGKLSITCQSMYTSFKFNTDVLIMKSLIKNLPNRSFEKPSWSHLEHINLADPEFNTSRPVDLLLGADAYALIMLDGLIRGPDSSSPLAQQTQLGWVLCGTVKPQFHCNVVVNNTADIHKFWQIEDIYEQNEISAEDQQCVEYYLSTTKRLKDGRYEVRLPMKQQASEKLGSSKEIALAQFRNLEKKLSKQESLAQQYKQFLSEYEELGHMKLATFSNDGIECFLPHHAVQRAESSTTKLRVVFNASAKTTSGLSLNDVMQRGPNLQQDLQALLLKWRQYRYVFTADIEKMYRQILISESDQKLQKIFWRAQTGQPIRAYQLTTVTYGTNSAPFLAMMTLRKLAADEKHNFPTAARIMLEDFYMDDLVSGAHTINEGKSSIAELNSCLSSGKFLLRKWSANEKRLLEDINSSQHNNEAPSFIFKTENTPKTLGLRWDPKTDEFTFQYTSAADTTKLTKRLLLSEISRLFDPLGWLAPLTTKFKLLFQKVWLDEIQWSDEVSSEIKNEWVKLTKDLGCISRFKIPRWLQSKRDDLIELHGFCDASLKAYACVVYARIASKNEVSVVLIAAKTRLVPNSKTVSLPRLELCAAELLTRLLAKIVTSMSNMNYEIYAWSDSKVVLSWIQSYPERWKPFVANRVKKIISVAAPDVWHYVSTKENPADSASRGQSITQLIEHTLWWRGPAWLSTPDFKPEREQAEYATNEEVRKLVITVQNSNPENSVVEDLLNRHSSFDKVNRIVAWILRAHLRKSKQRPSYLTLQELRKAKLIIIKCIQRSEFTPDIESLIMHSKPNSNSKLLNLQPFLDKSGTLRVGGRLKNANICSDMIHPIIIPYNGRLTELLIQQAHEHTFHGGARLTLSLLRQQYWIIQGNRATKKQLRKCVTCKKQEPRKLHQIMGDLPECRSNPAPPFYHTGIDYTGFIRVKANKGKGIKTTKGYIALFICMVTKAVHIELVSDLSSSSFLAALRRMAARRGTPKHIYSDNGTNFVGANKILQEEQQQFERIFSDTFYREIAEMSIEWHWNCPSWPSAGGIWERSIRSLKQHLKRVIGEQALTFEEYSTILAQIEASLNSRPLCPISEDIDDIDFLTPAHFLTTRAGLTVIDTAQDARTRWHLVNKTFQDIWKRWKAEYLSQLSIRSKWSKPQKNIEIGDMVTIHDDNLPPGRWPVGRVVEVHPGKDGAVRVVTLKTKNGFIKRPIIKLSILPIAENEAKKQHQQSNKAKAEQKASKQSSNGPKIYSIALSLLFFMSLVLSTEASYKLTTFSNNQSLYFDLLGQMHLIRDQWKIVTYYNMSPYWQGDKAVTQFSQYLEQTCEKIQKQSHCKIIILQIQHEYDELQYYNQLLLNQHFGAPSRTRRGLINAVGSIANSLFGVLDQEFAEKYKRDIELVHGNINHLSQLYRNQTSVIEAEYNILKRTEETIEKQHKIINKHLNLLDSVTNTLQQEIDVMSIQQDFSLAALATINMIQNLKRIQDTFLDTMTEIYHGQINLHLLTPQQLRGELQIISSQISKELALPIDDIQFNLYEIYKLLQVKARVTDEYFIFEINLPLISRDTFQLYNLIPVPVQINKSMISIKPVSEYVAINLRRDSYLTASVSDLQSCERQAENYLCRLRGPIQSLGHNEQFCEKEKLSKCRIIKSSCENKWVPLHDYSTYLYFCCDSYSLRVICDDDLQASEVSKAGLIQLTKQCIVKGHDITLYSHQQLENTLNLEPNILEVKLTPINRVVSNLTLPIQNFQDFKVDEDTTPIHVSLKQLGEQIQSMKKSTEQTEVLTTHDIHQYALLYGLLAAAIAVVLWFLRKRCLRARGPPAQGRVESVPASVSVCINQCEQEQNPSVSDSARVSNFSKRWSSLRLKRRDVSTSPLAKRQSVFSINDSTV